MAVTSSNAAPLPPEWTRSSSFAPKVILIQSSPSRSCVRQRMPGFQGGLVRRIRDDTDAEVYHLRKREAVHLGTGPFGFLYTHLRPPCSEEAHPSLSSSAPECLKGWRRDR